MNRGIGGFIALAFIFILFNCNGNRGIQDDGYGEQRKDMVERQIIQRGIHNPKVINAMMKVPRHKFVPEEYRVNSYDDMPLPIGYSQTISQPYIVAYMTEILKPDSTKNVLEIGTGSGYQAAILSMLYKNVYSIEIVEPLGIKAKRVFIEEHYDNIKTRVGDGYLGWKENAPFDAIIVTCAPDNIPAPLIDQLAEGGKMVIPVGDNYNQKLYLLEKKHGKISQTETISVIFVPMMREK
jgi:protein-L-isoaspartate(D-aspartate) O-methyltransferase